MKHLALFSLLEQQSSQPQPPPKNEEAVNKIRGLRYIPDYITEYQHDWLLDQIDKQQWLDDLKRRVQHYGPKFDSETGKLKNDMQMSGLPEWLNKLANKLHKDGHIPEVPNQVLINEYEPGQGIGGHIDKEPWFKDTIVNLSLGSSCIMEFTNRYNKTKRCRFGLRGEVLLSCGRQRDIHGCTVFPPENWMYGMDRSFHGSDGYH